MDDDKEVNVDDESLLASPTKAAEASDSGKNLSEARYIGPRQLTDEEREEALRAELEGVQNINTVIEGVLGSLERAKENMEACCNAQIPRITLIGGSAGCFSHCSMCYNTIKHLDKNSFADRA